MINPWPWPIKPLYWVYFALDWIDSREQPDHGKVQVDLVIWTALAFHYVGKPLSLGAMMILISASFGSRIWLAFLKSRVVTSVETVKRDESLGIQPTP